MVIHRLGLYSLISCTLVSTVFPLLSLSFLAWRPCMLFNLRHGQLKLSVLHHLHCWCSPAEQSFKLCVLKLSYVEIPGTKGQVPQEL